MKKIIAFMLAAVLVSGFAMAQDDDEWYPLQQGTISFRLGGFFPSADSDIWNDNVDLFTFEKEDFKNLSIGVEANWFINDMITIGLAVDFYNNKQETEYRDFVEETGDPIYQQLELTVTPVTATVKFTPLGNGSPGYGGERGSKIVPWIGGGIGLYAFSYEENGDFIDFSDDSIFGGVFLAEDTAFGFHVAGGVVVPVNLTWDVFVEGRYAWAKGDMGEDFTGFDDIDLGGASFHCGASYRF